MAPYPASDSGRERQERKAIHTSWFRVVTENWWWLLVVIATLLSLPRPHISWNPMVWCRAGRNGKWSFEVIRLLRTALPAPLRLRICYVVARSIRGHVRKSHCASTSNTVVIYQPKSASRISKWTHDVPRWPSPRRAISLTLPCKSRAVMCWLLHDVGI